MPRKNLNPREGERYIEYKKGARPFRVERVWGRKVHTHKGTVINRSRFTTKHYKPV